MALITGIVTLLTLFDYGQKWKIYPFVYDKSVSLFQLLVGKLFESVIVLALLILATAVYLLYIKVRDSKSESLENRISSLEEKIPTTLKESKSYSDDKVKSSEEKLGERIFKLEWSMIDIEIEDHKSKNQVGAMSGLVQKLKMAKKRGWGVEEVLFEMKEYIKERGMPHFYLEDLCKEVKACSENLDGLKNEVIKLAQEKLYKVN